MINSRNVAKGARKIAYMSILLTVSILANIGSFSLGLGYLGRFSLVYGASYLTGIFLGPYYGFVIALLGDIIPAAIWPQGPLMPLISLGTASISLIVGMANRYLPFRFWIRVLIGASISLIISTCVLNALGQVPLFDILPNSFAKFLGRVFNIKSRYWMLALAKLIIQPFWIAINLSITYVICYRLQRIIDKEFNGVIIRARDVKSAPEAVTLIEDFQTAE